MNAAALSYQLPKPFDRKTVDEILAFYDDPADGTAVPQSSGHFQYFAVEKTGENQEQWRVWVYPALNRTRYLTIKAPVYVVLSALTGTPDVDEVDARYISRFLAYEMTRKQKETSATFLGELLRPVPASLQRQYFNQAVASWQLQSGVIEYGGD